MQASSRVQSDFPEVFLPFLSTCTEVICHALEFYFHPIPRSYFKSRDNSSMHILFLHGWHSATGGVKPSYLRSRGCDVEEPHLPDDHFQAALDTAQRLYDSSRPDVIVGSSRGGAVAMNVQHASTPLVLLCPAWKRWGSVGRVGRQTILLHSRLDDVIPFEDSLELLDSSRLSLDHLMEVGGDHRLADEDSLAVMYWACEVLTSGQTFPWDDEEETSSYNRNAVLDGSEAEYLCDHCGEAIVVPVDLSQGNHQRYVEDCPVCCNPNVIHLTVDPQGRIELRADPEQDYY